jgi:hypothetical protein
MDEEKKELQEVLEEHLHEKKAPKATQVVPGIRTVGRLSRVGDRPIYITPDGEEPPFEHVGQTVPELHLADEKFCPDCNTTKSLSQFAKKSSNSPYYRKRCIPCHKVYEAAYNKRRREENPEHLKQIATTSRLRHYNDPKNVEKRKEMTRKRTEREAALGYPTHKKWAEKNKERLAEYARKRDYERRLVEGKADPNVPPQPKKYVMLTAWGETKNQKHWPDDPRCIVGYHTLRHRIENGWEPEAAMTTPKQTRLTEEQAEEIRQRYKQGGIIMKTLAGKYKISVTQVQRILSGRRSDP